MTLGHFYDFLLTFKFKESAVIDKPVSLEEHLDDMDAEELVKFLGIKLEELSLIGERLRRKGVEARIITRQGDGTDGQYAIIVGPDFKAFELVAAKQNRRFNV